MALAKVDRRKRTAETVGVSWNEFVRDGGLTASLFYGLEDLRKPAAFGLILEELAVSTWFAEGPAPPTKARFARIIHAELLRSVRLVCGDSELTRDLEAQLQGRDRSERRWAAVIEAAWWRVNRASGVHAKHAGWQDRFAEAMKALGLADAGLTGEALEQQIKRFAARVGWPSTAELNKKSRLTRTAPHTRRKNP